MARPVIAGDPGPVGTDDDGQAVKPDVEVPLVDGSGEERRVDRDDRTQTAHRHSRCRGEGVLLGDADVHEALRVAVLERQQTGRAGHRGGDRDDALVGGRKLDEGCARRPRL